MAMSDDEIPENLPEDKLIELLDLPEGSSLIRLQVIIYSDPNSSIGGVVVPNLDTHMDKIDEITLAFRALTESFENMVDENYSATRQ
jgi:hypothetical protein